MRPLLGDGLSGRAMGRGGCVALRRDQRRLRQAERLERALLSCHGGAAVAKREAKRRRLLLQHVPSPVYALSLPCLCVLRE